MADEDSFMDQQTIQKMIAAGIYDEDMANKLKGIKNKDLKDNTMIRPASERTPLERQPPQKANPFSSQNRGRGRGFGARGSGRGQRGHYIPQPGRGRSQRPIDPLGGSGRFSFQSTTAHKWQEIVVDEDGPAFHKRGRSSPQRDGFRDPFRDGIRDGIQTKIQRKESDRNLNSDFDDRNAGNSNDTDLRAKDTDSRIRDTDLRLASNPFINRKTTPNLQNITSTAIDADYRCGAGDGRSGGRGAPNPKSMIEEKFFGANRNQRGSVPNLSKNLIDDIDDFIEKASSKLNMDPSEINAMSSRGRGGANFKHGRATFPRSDDPLGLKQTDDSFSLRLMDDPLGLTQEEQSFDERAPEDSFDSGPEMTEAPPETDENPIAILKETVEELAKSNLYCQYCDCYLSSLIEVNTHIGTANHQKNMAKKVMEENNSINNNNRNNSQPKPKENQPISRPISQTIVERVPTGMAAIVQMIEQRKQITLKTLTEMVFDLCFLYQKSEHPFH